MKFRNMFLKYMTPAGNDGAADGSGMTDKPTGEDQTGEGETQQQQEQAKHGEGDNKPTDREAKLLKESMTRKARIQELEGEMNALRSQYEGLDVNLYKEMLEERKARQQQAEKDEQERLKAEGKFDELLAAQERQRESAIAQVKEHYEKELSGKESEIDGLKELLGKQDELIKKLTIENAFSSSQYIRDELVPAFTPSRTKKLYGEYFDVEGGKIVPYDKPVGDASRTVLVDKDGNPLAFDAAIARLVESDPDADAMKRSKHRPGAGSNSEGLPASQKASPIKPGVGRIEAALSRQSK